MAAYTSLGRRFLHDSGELLGTCSTGAQNGFRGPMFGTHDHLRFNIRLCPCLVHVRSVFIQARLLCSWSFVVHLRPGRFHVPMRPPSSNCCTLLPTIPMARRVTYGVPRRPPTTATAPASVVAGSAPESSSVLGSMRRICLGADTDGCCPGESHAARG